MYLETHKITDEPVRWEIIHDKTAEHVFSVKAKMGDWTQSVLGFTEKEAIALVEQLNFAIQDYQRGVTDGQK